jgi:hypothetical protein
VRDLIFAQFLKRLVRALPEGTTGMTQLCIPHCERWRTTVCRRGVFETFDCCGGKFFHKLHPIILRRMSEGSSHGRPITKSVGL